MQATLELRWSCHLPRLTRIHGVLLPPVKSDWTPNVPGSPMSVGGLAKASAPSMEHHEDPCLVRGA